MEIKNIVTIFYLLRYTFIYIQILISKFLNQTIFCVFILLIQRRKSIYLLLNVVFCYLFNKINSKIVIKSFVSDFSRIS